MGGGRKRHPKTTSSYKSHLSRLRTLTRRNSREILARVFSISPKTLLLLTVMVFLHKAMFLFFHVSVHASLRSLRPLKNTWPHCDKVGSSQLTWGRIRKARKSPLMILSRVSMLLLPMLMCSSSTFPAPTRPVYGACDTSIILLSLTRPRYQWSATTTLTRGSIARCSPSSRRGHSVIQATS